MNDATGYKSRILLQEIETRRFNFDEDEEMEAVNKRSLKKFFSRFMRNTNPSVFGAPF